MSFLNPGAFWLLLLIPLIVLLYLLKLRREDQLVSSTYLWRKLVRDMQANAPWQRLKPNFLLFLQLLFLLALILAIVRPFTRGKGIESKVVIIIFDTSASMTATDVAPNRIGAAKESAIRLVQNLSGDARITIITAGRNAHTLLSLSQDHRLVREAISQIKAFPTGTDLSTALQIASAIAQRQSDSQTIVYTDGNFTLPETAALPSNLRWEMIGELAENQSIELLTLQTNPADRTLTAFAQIANYGSSPAKRRVTVLADGTTVNAFDIEIPPNGEKPILATGIFSETQVVEARLLPAETEVDRLLMDDHVFVVNRKAAPSRVVLVSGGNRFLETALSLMPQIELHQKQLTDPIEPDTALVIYDGVTPSILPPAGVNLLFLGPLESTEFFSVTGKLELPIPVIIVDADPIVQGVDVKGISILDSAQIFASTWAKTLIADSLSTEPRPALLFAGETAGRRVAVLSFNLNHSDLPLQVAFPVLMSNLVGWLAPGLGGLIPTAISPGDPIPLTALLAQDRTSGRFIKITRPDGTSLQIDPDTQNPVIADTLQPGIYTVTKPDGAEVSFAVNLFSPQESRIEPGSAPMLTFGEAQNSQLPTQHAKQEWWRPIAALSLLLLTLEWLVYHRAALSQLFNRLQKSISLRKRQTG